MDCTFCSAYIPSKCDLFLEYDGAHDGGHDHAQRVEGRDEHRASLPRHETLHVVGHAGAHYALEGSITVHGSCCQGTTLMMHAHSVRTRAGKRDY